MKRKITITQLIILFTLIIFFISGFFTCKTITQFRLFLIITISILIFEIISLSIYLIYVYLKNVEIIKNRLNRLNKDLNIKESITPTNSYAEIINENLDLIYNKVINEQNNYKHILGVINKLNHGFMIIKKDGSISLANNYIKSVFNIWEDCINKQYFYLIRDNILTDKIEESRLYKKDLEFDVNIDDKIYFVQLEHIESILELKDGIILTLIDVTDDRKAKNMKQQFFANASHELKSPLTSIIGYQQMISSKIIDDPKEIENAINKTLKEAFRMDRIIVEMLDLSRLESGVSLKPEKVNVNLIIKEILDSFKNEIEKKKLKIILKTTNTNLIMEYRHAYQVFKNIIDNAIKYNKDEGFISIELNSKEFICTDSGLGIPKDSLSRIFERFYRVDKLKSRSSGGTGLGLAIVKHICQVYKFEYNISSKQKYGTKFQIKFS